MLLKIAAIQSLFLYLNGLVLALQDATRAGTSFVFGYLGGGPPPFGESYPGASLILGLLPEMAGASLTLERMLGWIMTPFAWLLGVPWDRAETAGKLLGMKVVFNEFIAYLELGKMGDDVLDPRSRMILVYALCGFANLGSLGIML